MQDERLSMLQAQPRPVEVHEQPSQRNDPRPSRMVPPCPGVSLPQAVSDNSPWWILPARFFFLFPFFFFCIPVLALAITKPVIPGCSSLASSPSLRRFVSFRSFHSLPINRNYFPSQQLVLVARRPLPVHYFRALFSIAPAPALARCIALLRWALAELDRNRNPTLHAACLPSQA